MDDKQFDILASPAILPFIPEGHVYIDDSRCENELRRKQLLPIQPKFYVKAKHLLVSIAIRAGPLRRQHPIFRRKKIGT